MRKQEWVLQRLILRREDRDERCPPRRKKATCRGLIERRLSILITAAISSVGGTESSTAKGPAVFPTSFRASKGLQGLKLLVTRLVSTEEKMEGWKINPVHLCRYRSSLHHVTVVHIR